MAPNEVLYFLEKISVRLFLSTNYPGRQFI